MHNTPEILELLVFSIETFALINGINSIFLQFTLIERKRDLKFFFFFGSVLFEKVRPVYKNCSTTVIYSSH